MKRVHSYVIAAAALVAGAIAVIAVGASGDREREADPEHVVRAAGREGTRLDAGPTAPVDADATRLAPVEVVDRDPVAADPVDDGPPSTHRTPPPVGAYRLVGRVLGEGGVTPAPGLGAVVRVTLYLGHDDSPTVLGTAAVDARGFYALDLPHLVSTVGRNTGSAGVSVQLRAPGYELSDDYADLDEAEDSILRTELWLEPCAVVVSGRVVDLEGEPVARASIGFVDWNIHSVDDPYRDTLASEADGSFAFQLEHGERVDVLVAHESHGVGQVGHRIDRRSAAVDLGDVVLEPRGVISGRVLALDGTPVPHLEVTAAAVADDGDGALQSVRTDGRGRFRFANLDPVAYALDPGYAENDDDLPVLTPNATDVVLRLAFPTLMVRVLDPEGRPVVADGFTCNGIGDSSSEFVDEDTVAPGVVRIVLGAPGTYVLGAHAWFEEERWSVAETIEIGRGHRDLDLRLERDDVVPVRLVVTDPDGAELTDWWARTTDADLGTMGPSLSCSREINWIEPGTWVVRLRPKQNSLMVAFRTTIEVEDTGTRGGEPQVVRVAAERMGARVSVSAVPTDEYGGTVTVRLASPDGKTSSGVVTAKLDGSKVTIPTLISPGEYDLVVRRAAKKGVPAAELRRRVRLEAGEREHVSVAFPGS